MNGSMATAIEKGWEAMTRRNPRRVALPAALLITAGLTLASCTGGESAEQAGSSPTPTPTASNVEVTDETLGLALDRMLRHDAASADDGACFASAVRDADLGDKALTHLVASDADDLGAVAISLRTEVGDQPADVLRSDDLRGQFDDCVDAEVAAGSANEEAGQEDYESVSEPDRTVDGEPNLEPEYAIEKDEEIRSAQQLTDGVVSMFSSYALDEAQAEAYAMAGECLSTVIYDSGLSQESLRFIAGGAPLGAGEIADYLTTDEDKEIWRSTQFSTALVDCIETGSDGQDESLADQG